MVTAALGDRCPPGPDAERVYVVSVAGHTDREPLAATEPMPGSMDRLVAREVVQVRVEQRPLVIVPGNATRLPIGVSRGLTRIVTVGGGSRTPPRPAAFSRYVVVSEGQTERDPDAGTSPTSGCTNWVAESRVLQLRVEHSPRAITRGLAPMLPPGGTSTVTVTWGSGERSPPGPEAESV